MRLTRPTSTNNLSLAEVIAKLVRHDAVDGLLFIGSTGRAQLSASSDYDLIVILNRSPISLRVALTYIDGRLTDVIFVDARELMALVQGMPGDVPAVWGEAALLRWLRGGTIAFDRSGQLAAAQAVAAARPPDEPTENELFSAWFSINYNLRQNLRMVASDDETYLIALDLRLLYSLFDCWWYYFLLRKLPERGEKAQVRYMQAHDPEYLALFRACLAEGDRARRFALYRRLAELTVAPAGGLWAEDATSVLPETGIAWQADTPDRALAFWAELLGHEDG
ncbi:MAG: hypothetical protein BWY52_00618 [Chloroflexi bacterium ADurb.Bin325]|nr:MAG: hypothetical protein BWY52_00618 [Chloroflexi bacterium ADurb.Bin325]